MSIYKLTNLYTEKKAKDKKGNEKKRKETNNENTSKKSTKRLKGIRNYLQVHLFLLKKAKKLKN